MLRPLDLSIARTPPKRADPELQTSQHRAWAAEVKRRAGYRCEDCGAQGCKLEADHIDERKDGGAQYDPANGRCRCVPCHVRKTNAARATRMAR